MELTGQVWFDFRSPDVWTFYRFVRSVAQAGHPVGLAWTPVGRDDEEEAAATFAALESPVDRGRFLHAMLGLTHLEGADPSDPGTVAAARAAAHIDGTAQDADEVARWRSEARQLGVAGVPALYRHGPATVIRLTNAALDGDIKGRAERIFSTADDDGIWELVKP